MSKLWPKYENWSKLGTEHQVYRYTPKVYRYTLAKNDQNPKCTGTLWPKMTRTQSVPVQVQSVPVQVSEKCPECVFSPIFHALFHPKPNLYFIYTSKSFQIHLVSSIILKSSFNGYLSSKFFHESLQKPF